jgi:5'-AMP-activated protein kinase catalytic alpha subunit
MRHRNIIRLYEVLETKDDIFLVMEYASGGDLLSFMKRRRSLPEKEAKEIFRQVVNSVGHCHCRSVLHRDVKLDNILLDEAGKIKLCDFGISRIVSDHRAIMREQCGTPAYIAPEIMAD